MSAHDVLVRGAGAVGLVTALALSRQGLRVALLGSLDEPQRPDIRAYALNAASVRLLASLKVWDAIPAAARTAVHEMHIEGDAAGAALDFSAWAQRLTELAFIVDAGELERALRAAVRFAPHVDAVATEAPAALLVLAEGKHSATRQALGVRMAQHGYGHRGIAARLIAPQPHAGLARQWFRSPDVLALLPMDQPAAVDAGPGYGVVWSVPDARADELMALDEAAFTAELMAATGGAAGPLTLCSERAQWPLMLAHAQPVFGPGWVLVGDAAHVVHPLAGQGLNLGFADVASLADTLAGRESWRSVGDAKLLARHARARHVPVRATGQVSDVLLHLFASPWPVARELRNRGLTLVNHLGPVKRALTRGALG